MSPKEQITCGIMIFVGYRLQEMEGGFCSISSKAYEKNWYAVMQFENGGQGNDNQAHKTISK